MAFEPVDEFYEANVLCDEFDVQKLLWSSLLKVERVNADLGRNTLEFLDTNKVSQ